MACLHILFCTDFFQYFINYFFTGFCRNDLPFHSFFQAQSHNKERFDISLVGGGSFKWIRKIHRLEFMKNKINAPKPDHVPIHVREIGMCSNLNFLYNRTV